MPRINEESNEVPQLNRPKATRELSQSKASQTADTSKALTKQVIDQSTDALTNQIKSLATRMDASDRNLARQLAGYVADRPQRFSIMFAQELSALMAPTQDTPQMFVDQDLAVIEMPDLTADFLAIAPSTVLGCLPM